MRDSQGADLVFGDAQGFLRSAVLASCVSSGAADALGVRGGTVAGVAEATGWRPRMARALLDALVAMGYAEKADARYTLRQVGKDCLVRGGARYCGDVVQLITHPEIWSAMGRLADVSRVDEAGVEAVGAPSMVDSRRYWSDFARKSEWLVRPVAETMVAALGVKELRKETWVLDVGCGNGLCALGMVASNPVVNAVLVDRADVLAVAGGHAERLGVSDRVVMLAGDALEVGLPMEVDIVIVSLVLHHYDLNTCRRLLRHLGRYMKMGGRMVVHDYLREEPVPEDVTIALLAAVMTACTMGDIHALSDYEEILGQCGFRDWKVVEAAPGGESWLILAEKG